MADILLVDDDKQILKAYTDLLQKAGFSVRTAANGQEALEEASRSQPDLILLDILMPKMSGLDFLKQYKPKQEHPKVKVIMLTNVEEPFYSAMELGATDFIVKSDYSGKELVEVINKNLGLSK